MSSPEERLSRRGFMEQSLWASGAGLAADLSLEQPAPQARAGESRRPPAAETPAQDLPTGKIGKLAISRLICGGNLFSGSALQPWRLSRWIMQTTRHGSLVAVNVF